MAAPRNLMTPKPKPNGSRRLVPRATAQQSQQGDPERRPDRVVTQAQQARIEAA